jgi:Uma2 family endonuclease
MATATEPKVRPLEPEQRVVLRGVGWEGYETLLAMVGDHSPVRLIYDQGDVELMAPSYNHKDFKTIFGRIVETVTEELRIPCHGLGSTTWRKRLEDQGLEADECYYLGHMPPLRGKKNLHLSVDPPPDLAIEVEISRSALNRMGIYAAFGIPEVWRWDGETLRVAHLQPDGTYAEVTTSPSLPFLPLDEVVRWLRLAEEADNHSEWNRRFREWVRDVLVPRFEGR